MTKPSCTFDKILNVVLKPNSWRAFYLHDYKEGIIASHTYWELHINTTSQLHLQYLTKENYEKFVRGLPYDVVFEMYDMDSGLYFYNGFQIPGGSFFVLKNDNPVGIANVHFQGAAFFDGSDVPFPKKKLNIQKKTYKQNGKSYTIYNTGDHPIHLDTLPIHDPSWEYTRCVTEPVFKKVIEPQKYIITSTKPNNETMSKIGYVRVYLRLNPIQQTKFIHLNEENLAKFLRNEPYKPINEIEGGDFTWWRVVIPPIDYFVTMNKYSRSPETFLMNKHFLIIN